MIFGRRAAFARDHGELARHSPPFTDSPPSSPALPRFDQHGGRPEIDTRDARRASSLLQGEGQAIGGANRVQNSDEPPFPADLPSQERKGTSEPDKNR